MSTELRCNINLQTSEEWASCPVSMHIGRTPLGAQSEEAETSTSCSA